MAFCEHISHERLLELLDYNEATGDFRWRKDKTGGVKAGDIAGTILTPKGRNTSYRTISLDNRMYRAHRLAWFYVHKEQIDETKTGVELI